MPGAQSMEFQLAAPIPQLGEVGALRTAGFWYWMSIGLGLLFHLAAVVLNCFADFLDFIGNCLDWAGVTISFEFLSICLGLILFRRGSWILVLLSVCAIIYLEARKRESDSSGVYFGVDLIGSVQRAQEHLDREEEERRFATLPG